MITSPDCAAVGREDEGGGGDDGRTIWTKKGRLNRRPAIAETARPHRGTLGITISLIVKSPPEIAINRKRSPAAKESIPVVTGRLPLIHSVESALSWKDHSPERS